MKTTGVITKMQAAYSSPIQYTLNLNDETISVNQLLEQKIAISFNHYQCLECGKEKEIFAMGCCKNCYFTSPHTGRWVVNPELSTAHLGIGERDLAVEEAIQLQLHIVYLAYTGDVKVGVTRESQIPTRWIDQGATFALPIAKTENRYEAGMIEVALKEHLADKTNWRKMLEDDFEDDLDLADFREKIKDYFPDNFKNFYSMEHEMLRLDYPYEAPEKINSFTLDKKPEFEGILRGIKGQYLSFEGGDFINVRGHEGYVIELNIS